MDLSCFFIFFISSILFHSISQSRVEVKLKPSALEAEKDAILRLHNDKRDGVSPSASNPLPHLKWDDGLARTAQAWSDRCDWTHGHVCEKETTMGPGGKPLGTKYMGQNLAAGWPTRSWKSSIKSWDEEKKDYHFCANSATPNKMVGHYTQVVWQETTHVGCGKAKCATIKSSPHSTSGELITCNYWPSGNINIAKCRPYASSCGGSNRPTCDGSSITEKKCEPALDDSKLDEGSDSSSARFSAIRSLIFLTSGPIAYIVF